MLPHGTDISAEVRVAIVLSHPTQYYSPWFRHIARLERIRIKVFYLWNAGVTETRDPDFKTTFCWDVPLLNGYDYSFVANISKTPGTSCFSGLHNPDLFEAVSRFVPNAVLIFGYKYRSILDFITRWSLLKKAPLLFRGDSHLLGRDEASTFRSFCIRQAIRAVYSRFAGFLYAGKANRAYFRHHAVPENKLFFAPHAVDNARFIGSAQDAAEEARLWRIQMGVMETNQLILFAGKLEPKKRPQELLEAFSQLRLPGVSLLFAGSGVLERELRTRAAGMANVFFAPFQNQSQMPRTYASADIYVLPSAGREETWGLAVNEAMCMSKPVIVSDHVGCAQDLVIPERNGMISRAGDVNSLANALKFSLEDSRRLKRWGDESLKMIANYSYTQTTDGLENALREIGVLKRADFNHTSASFN